MRILAIAGGGAADRRSTLQGVNAKPGCCGVTVGPAHVGIGASAAGVSVNERDVATVTPLNTGVSSHGPEGWR